jgi:tRNA(fMet)-specific endonuclease VapC
MGRLVYLLDTNTISEPSKQSQNAQVMAKLDKFQDKIAIPIFVIFEMIHGAYLLPESKKRTKILDYIESTVFELKIFDYSIQAAEWNGKETARLQRIGKSPSYIDSQIAAIAKVNNLILVTRNTTDFEHFAGIQLENWFL